MYRNVKVYGKDAKKLIEGEDYRVVKYSVEGHLVAELVEASAFCTNDGCGEYLKSYEDGHGGDEYYCPKCDV